MVHALLWRTVPALPAAQLILWVNCTVPKDRLRICSCAAAGTEPALMKVVNVAPQDPTEVDTRFHLGDTNGKDRRRRNADG
jgi:hypothetical protein